MMMTIDDDDDDERTTKWCWWRRWWWSYNRYDVTWPSIVVWEMYMQVVILWAYTCMKCLTTQEEEIRINLSDLKYWYNTCTFISFVLVESPNHNPPTPGGKTPLATHWQHIKTAWRLDISDVFIWLTNADKG